MQGYDGNGYFKGVLGSERYMAPEIINEEVYKGNDVDLFALGVILFNCYSRSSPFTIANPY
jgi:serine/threonine protein kinase